MLSIVPFHQLNIVVDFPPRKTTRLRQRNTSYICVYVHLEASLVVLTHTYTHAQMHAHTPASKVFDFNILNSF